MTKAGKILVILLTVFSVTFMSLAASYSLTSTDWKARAAEYPEKITAQKARLEELDAEVPVLQSRIAETRRTIELDLVAIKNRETALTQELQKVHDTIGELSQQAVAEAKQAQAKREEAKLRREEATRLRNQLEELRAEKDALIVEHKRLKDLLFQAEGTLERLDRRRQLLESDKARLSTEEPYEKETTETPAAAVPGGRQEAEPRQKPGAAADAA